MSDPRDSFTAELTVSMAAGKPAAVEAFYRRYFDFLYAHARWATRRDEAFCLDVVQEAVLRIIRNVRAVQSRARLEGWLALVVRTTAYDLLKAERRRQVRETAVMAARETPEGGDGEQIERLKAQISRLDPELARMIELRYTQSWTLKRIAGLLGLSVGTVDGRLRRALVLLRNELRDFHDVRR